MLHNYKKPGELLQEDIHRRIGDKPYLFIGLDVNEKGKTTYLTNLTKEEIISMLSYALNHYTQKQLPPCQ